MAEFGDKILSSFTPITMDEAIKFAEVSYEMSKAIHPELTGNYKIVFTAAWYEVTKDEGIKKVTK